MFYIGALSFSISESNINIANNTSVITVSLLFTGNSVSWDYNAYGTLVIDGTSFSFKKGFSKNCGTITLTTQSKTVTHNSVGGGSISVSATYVTATSVFGTQTASQGYTLQTIPRASSFTLPSSIEVGSTGAYTISSASSGFTHKISFALGGSTYYLLGSASSASSSKSGRTAAIPTTSAFLSKITSANGVTVTATCTTYNGGTQLGTQTRNFTIKLRSTDKPTISNLQITDTNTASSALGCWVNGFSIPKVTFSASATTGTTLNNYDILIGRFYEAQGQSLGSSTSVSKTCSKLWQSGTLPVTVIVRDARGAEVSQVINIESLKYVSPTCTITAWRCNQEGLTDGNGTSIKCTVAWTYESLNGKNGITSCSLSYKNHKDSQWSAFTNVTMPENGGTTETINAEFLMSNSYDVQLVVTDKLGQTKDDTFTVGVAAKTMSFKPAIYDDQKVMTKDAGIAIGKYAETNELFEVDWNSQFNKDFQVGGFSQFQGGYGSGTTSESPYVTSIAEINNGTKYINGTGILKIILPQGYNNSIVKFDVEFYAFASYAVCTYSFAGQLYHSDINDTWSRPVCKIDGVSNISNTSGHTLSDLPVSFGRMGDKAAVSLGIGTTRWQYCAISIKNFQAFYPESEVEGLKVEKWSSGWDIVLDTNELDGTDVLTYPITIAKDYVIEQGTSGIWRYEKWNSGKMVAWNPGKQLVSAADRATSTLGYDRSCTVSLPTAMTTVENVSGFAAPAAGIGSIWGTLSGWSQSGSTLYIYASGNGPDLNIVLSLKLIGRWK